MYDFVTVILGTLLVQLFLILFGVHFRGFHVGFLYLVDFVDFFYFAIPQLLLAESI